MACGASSYHGPASTSPGGATPLGAVAKGLTHKARYPVPSPFFRRRGEADEAFHARMLADFEAYLDMYEHPNPNPNPNPSPYPNPKPNPTRGGGTRGRARGG